MTDYFVPIAEARELLRRPSRPETRHNSGPHWNTDDELAFLRGLGRWALDAARRPRSELLAGYLTAAYRRREWGRVDVEVVVAYAETAYREHTGRTWVVGR